MIAVAKPAPGAARLRTVVFPEGFNDYDLALGDSGDMLDLFEACGPGGRLSATDVYLSELPKTVLRKAT